MTTLVIGPFSFPAVLLVGIIAIFLGLLVAYALDRQRPSRMAEPLLSRWLIIAIIAGRLGFVSQYASTYQRNPWSILDLRDGGFSLSWALAILIIGVTLSAWRRPAVRRALLGGAAAGISALGIGYAGLALWGNQQGMVLPDVALNTLDGQPTVLSDYQGRPAVINLWATWCPPCRREMPVLAAGQQQHSDLHFIFANQREGAETIRDYLDAENLSLDNILIDSDGKLAQSIQSNGLPTTIFLDAQGHVVDIRIGELSDATLQDRIKSLMQGAPPLPSQE